MNKKYKTENFINNFRPSTNSYSYNTPNKVSTFKYLRLLRNYIQDVYDEDIVTDDIQKFQSELDSYGIYDSLSAGHLMESFKHAIDFKYSDFPMLIANDLLNIHSSIFEKYYSNQYKGNEDFRLSGFKVSKLIMDINSYKKQLLNFKLNNNQVDFLNEYRSKLGINSEDSVFSTNESQVFGAFYLEKMMYRSYDFAAPNFNRLTLEYAHKFDSNLGTFLERYNTSPNFVTGEFQEDFFNAEISPRRMNLLNHTSLRGSLNQDYENFIDNSPVLSSVKDETLYNSPDGRESFINAEKEMNSTVWETKSGMARIDPNAGQPQLRPETYVFTSPVDSGNGNSGTSTELTSTQRVDKMVDDIWSVTKCFVGAAGVGTVATKSPKAAIVIATALCLLADKSENFVKETTKVIIKDALDVTTDPTPETNDDNDNEIDIVIRNGELGCKVNPDWDDGNPRPYSGPEFRETQFRLNFSKTESIQYISGFSINPVSNVILNERFNRYNNSNNPSNFSSFNLNTTRNNSVNFELSEDKIRQLEEYLRRIRNLQ